MNFDDCYRLIADIPDQELAGLIGNQEENQWIEFKREYPLSGSRIKLRREICKDVTAMANSEGGYILIGVDATDELATGFCSVGEPERVAESINSICLDFIDPRIRGLEVKPRSITCNGNDITLVIIHIPPSEVRPHSILLENAIQFVRRYGNHTREYRMTDLRDDFSARQLPSGIRELHDKLDNLSGSALGQRDIADLIGLFERRFDEVLRRLS